MLRPLLCAALALAGSASAGPFTNLIAFGDSLSDRGNTVAELYEVLNQTDTYNSNFYADGRWSNGPLWIEHVNTALGLGPWQRNDGNPLSNGRDFAWGGSESGAGYTDLVLPNLQTQIDFYLDNVVLGSDVGTTLYSVWSGGNDVINAIQANVPIDEDALTTTMAANIAAAITTLYNEGGRFFLVPNLPDLGRKPNFRLSPFYAGEATVIVNLYNPKLAAQLDQLAATLPGITIYRVDAYDFLNDVIANPSDFGFANVTQPAYVSDGGLPEGGFVRPDPDSYLFWDTTHPTKAGHALLAQRALAALGLGLTGADPTDRARPAIRVRGKRVRTIGGARALLVGSATDDRQVARVEYRLPGRAFRAAYGRSPWLAGVRVPVGRTRVTLRAVDTAGKRSLPKTVIVVRR